MTVKTVFWTWDAVWRLQGVLCCIVSSLFHFCNTKMERLSLALSIYRHVLSISLHLCSLLRVLYNVSCFSVAYGVRCTGSSWSPTRVERTATCVLCTVHWLFTLACMRRANCCLCSVYGVLSLLARLHASSELLLVFCVRCTGSPHSPACVEWTAWHCVLCIPYSVALCWLTLSHVLRTVSSVILTGSSISLLTLCSILPVDLC